MCIVLLHHLAQRGRARVPRGRARIHASQHFKLPLLSAMSREYLSYQELQSIRPTRLLEQRAQHVGLRSDMCCEPEPQPVQNIPRLLWGFARDIDQALIEITMISLDESKHIDPHGLS